MDKPCAFRPEGKKGIGFRGLTIEGSYGAWIVGILREIVEAHCIEHYDERVAQLEAKKGGARAAENPMGNRLECEVLEDLARGEAVAKNAN